MCGLSGFVNVESNSNTQDLTNLIRHMNDKIRHRGPDDDGIWTDASNGIAIGHRRLAIIDLSPLGHQPMTSSCNRYVIAYNGEVYNFPDLKKELSSSGRTFKSHSDTEVILEGCAQWGVEETTRKLIGMFAFAIWDKKDKQLWLVRDRLGIKPLYWSLSPGRNIIFGSELKALRAHPDCPTDINRNAVAGFMRHNYIAGPQTIYQNVFKLQPGHILRFSAEDSSHTIKPFWNMNDVVTNASRNPFAGNDDDAIMALDDLLSDAVRKRMVSDVPLGAFLSGGIDSSAVVALMQKQSDRPIRSFSIGFDEEKYNEAQHAARVAKHLGTDHTELYVSAQDALDVIPNLADHFDEPFADSSQVPTCLVSALTKNHVTVALSGDGGDELFAGYSRYFQANQISHQINRIPSVLRHPLGLGLKSLPTSFWNLAAKCIPAHKRPQNLGARLHKMAELLHDDDGALYRSMISHWPEPNDIVIGGQENHGLLWDANLDRQIPDFIARMQYLDTQTYLPDDILTKVDRASMAVALEARVPLLDHRVVEFAWSLPKNMKIRDGQGKWLLRQVLYQYVPQNLIDRPKMGFGVPIDHWLRGPLRDWAENLLSPETFARHNLLRYAPVRQKWEEHLSGKANWQYHIWDVLMLHAWADKNT
ncbi:asparagine synthase (glutamine-hydrolyzing) [Thalassospira sp. MCCC 1A01428]|uniref:asparagine synthase (glutamine-hydrolyzing) n=1 Tax=Thalassospira sp. MCCC 1A01428 TaxID=1470575 RepID=UPI000A1D73A9|nr:asparagine synthase (glutamine-hydrolyzing) [Thalassospira sp. MCCC 1A01428]OSQ41764.1 asparagine synthase [Thalassospira sp. MCCC 1A01428]